MIDEDKLESVFAAVLPLSEEQRSAYLDDACGGDTELRQRIDALLLASVAAGSFFDKPPAGLQPTIATGQGDTVDEAAGEISLDFLTSSDKPNCLGTLDQYEVMDVIGRGGMGLVLRAYDTKLNRVVAIKAMAPELAANAMAVKRFLREARAAAAVSHDHVVTIHAIDEENKPPFIVMEYVDGLSLQEKIDGEGSLELIEILRVGMQTATGLAAAHKQGLMHRDIKPANILLENGIERVKITDFGLARAVDDVGVTQTGQIAGTPQYMSPEQAQGQPVDARTDLFSLGSVMYAMCAGRPPFRADTVVAALRRVCDDTPRPLREVNADIPEWLEAIVAKLLAKDPDQRFQSAGEVAELLGEHLAHLQHPTTAPKPPSVVPPKRESKPRPSPVAMFDTSNWSEGKKRFSKYLTIALVLVSAIITAAAVIYIQTDYGTVRIEVLDPDAKVVLRCDDGHRRIEIKDYDITIGVRSGDNTLHIKHGDLEFETDKFSVKRGEKVAVRVSRVEGALEVRAGDVVIGRKDLPIQARAPSQSEIAELLKDATLVMNFENGTFSGSDKSTVRDLSGNGNDGTCLGKTTWQPDGKNGGALALEEGGLKFERPLIPGSESFTVAGWFKLGKPTGPAGLNRWHVYDERLDSRWSDLNLTIQNGGLELGYRYPETAKRAGRHQAMALHTFPGRGPWFFAAWTYDAHNHFTYTINELSVSSADLDLTQRQQGTKRDAVIGRDFNGMMDDVVVFNRALSKEELKKLYEFGRAGHSLPNSTSASNAITEVRRFEGHTDMIDAIVYTPDGKQIVTGGFDETLRVWDAASGELLDTMHTPHAVLSLAASPKSNLVASGMSGSHVVLWDLGEKRDVRRFVGHERSNWRGGTTGHILAVAFSPDGTKLASGSDDLTARVWDVASGKQLAKFEANGSPVQSICWTSDGKRILAGEFNGTLTAWDVGTQELVQRSDDVSGKWIALSPDDRRIATNLRLLDAESFQLARRLENKDNVAAVAPQFSKDGRRVVAGSGTTLVRVWDAVTGKELARVDDAPGQTNKVAISPDGRQIAFGGGGSWNDKENRLIKTADNALRVWRLPESVWPQVGRIANASHENQITEIRRFGDLHVERLKDVVVVPTRSGRQVATASSDGTVRLWNVDTGNQVQALLEHERGVLAVAASADGNTLATADGSGSVRLWNRESGKVIHHLKGHDGWLFDLAFSHDGKKLYVPTAKYAGKVSGSVIVYDVSTGERLRELSNIVHGIHALAPIPGSSQVLVGGEYHLAGVWDGDSGERLRKFTGLHEHAYAIALSPDAKRAATGQVPIKMRNERFEDPETAVICIWDVETGKLTSKLRGHTGSVHGLAWTPDGRYLVSGSGGQAHGQTYSKSWDNSLRVWDVATGQQVASVDLGVSINSLAILPDGQHVVTAGGDDGKPDLRLWRLPEQLWPKSAASDNELIQGKWRSLSVIDNGEQRPQEELSERFMTFTGDRFTGPQKRQPRPSRFVLDATTDPKQIDLHFPAENDASLLIRGIYRLEGDRLTIFMQSDWTSTKRPTDFTTNAGDKRSLMLLERVPDQELLQGTWQVVALEGAGQTAPESAVKDKRFLIKGDRISLTGKPDDLRAFRLRPAVNPKQIDIAVNKEGHFDSIAIYALNGNTLKFCFSQRTKDSRPTKFNTEGTRYFCYTLKREDKAKEH